MLPADMVLGGICAAEALLDKASSADYARIVGLWVAAGLLGGEAMPPKVAGPTPRSFTGLLEQLRARRGLDFTLLSERLDCVVLQVDLRPWEHDLSYGEPLCRVIASIFGGLALLCRGYAKAVLSKPPRTSRRFAEVAIYLERTPESEAADGLEFTPSLGELLHDNGARSASQVAARIDELVATDEIIRKINSSIELDTVLHEVTKAAKRLLRTDMALISFFEAVTGELVPQAWEGISDASAVAMRVKLGEFIGGRAVQERRPVISDDIANDPRVTCKKLVSQEEMRSALAVPLLAKNEAIGVLGVQTHARRTFTERDVSLLTTLANQAAIAIENARLYERERATVLKLQELNDLISAQSEQLRRSLAIHEQFTALALAGRGLEAIAATVAMLVGNPVVVENRFFQIIAHAAPDQTRPSRDGAAAGTPREVIEQPSFQILLRAIAKERRPTRLEPRPGQSGQSRVLAPIVVEDEVLGYVSVPEVTRRLEELDLVAIEHAATVMALEFMRQKTALEVELRLKGDFLDDLLTGAYDSASTIIARAGYFGYNLSEPHRLAIVDLDDFTSVLRRAGHDEREAIAIKRRLFAVVHGVVTRCSKHSLVVAKGDAINVMINLAEAKGDVAALFERIRCQVTRVMPEITVSIGVGRECGSLPDFQKSWEEAQRALQLVKNAGRRNEVIWFERLGLQRLLYLVNDKDELTRFTERVLGRLMAYDRQHHTELVTTLDKYLLSDHNVRRCAQSLNIHVNTLAYRLQRIRDVGAFNLDCPEERLEVEVALQILRATPR